MAEVGSNWKTFDDCSNSITQAKLCGADAVKFQMFTHEELYGFPLMATPYGTKEEKKYELLSSLPREWIQKLKEKCDAVGIEFMCTAFSPEGYEFIDPYVKLHKVASSELTHRRILSTLRKLEKPILLSTACASQTEIRDALFFLDGLDVTLMYCVGAYPARVIELGNIHLLHKVFGNKVGYSDHSTDVLCIPSLACEMGATVIEKHVTFIDSETPDSPHSLSADEFKTMVEGLRERYEIKLGPTPAEKQMVMQYRRRIIATKNIEPGDRLIEGVNFGIFRSKIDDTKACHGFYVDMVENKNATHAVAMGEGIGPMDIT